MTKADAVQVDGQAINALEILIGRLGSVDLTFYREDSDKERKSIPRVLISFERMFLLLKSVVGKNRE
jgi:hypothetical protein